ncbi:nucleoside recognition domain protein [Ammonifex degensii KC4]|uniref:Nucleoside recognition domain protein n=1 Tax=Ammonifex degensii (strain DSM 10501 / KC4) TaxID=429009 RepID=C9RAL1_AMMDK|nr:nucleoside recognition domain-containing protein [Ammonifex degensii]ACX51288.1 nucleoside recognition domain protein [Ammonifex degensii KC4]
MRPATARALAGSLLVVFFVIMITHPAAVYRGALRGLSIWWEVVFPSLLPFFITTELLLAFGVIHFLGSLLEPLTFRLFRLPGTAAFVLAVGFTSGYPMGAAAAARLKSQGLLTAAEAARLAAFANNSSPLFILVAVAVGIYRLPEMGPFLALVHYGSNLLVGLTFRFFSPAGRPFLPRSRYSLAEGRKLAPLGQTLGEAMRQAVNNLLVIAGFIGLFGVLWELLKDISDWQGGTSLLFGAGAGFLEVTLGIKGVAETALPLKTKVWLTEVWLAWQGLSVIVQVWSFLSQAGVSLLPFLGGRILQIVYASILTLALFPFFASGWSQAAAAHFTFVPSFSWVLLGSTGLCLASFLFLLLLALVIGCCRFRS